MSKFVKMLKITRESLEDDLRELLNGEFVDLTVTEGDIEVTVRYNKETLKKDIRDVLKLGMSYDEVVKELSTSTELITYNREHLKSFIEEVYECDIQVNEVLSSYDTQLLFFFTDN